MGPGTGGDHFFVSCPLVAHDIVHAMADNKMEPFPPLSPPKGAFDKHGGPPVTMSKPRPRRKSSSLGGEPRGDTGVGALATLTSLPQVCQLPCTCTAD